MKHELHEVTANSVTAYIDESGAYLKDAHDEFIISSIKRANKLYISEDRVLHCIFDDSVLKVNLLGDYTVTSLNK